VGTKRYARGGRIDVRPERVGRRPGAAEVAVQVIQGNRRRRAEFHAADVTAVAQPREKPFHDLLR